MIQHAVMDFETLITCTVLCIEDYKTEEHREFVVHKLRDDRKELFQYLRDSATGKYLHIGFNSINFDAQISHYILKNQKLLSTCTPEEFARKIHDKAQDVVERGNKREFQEFPEWRMVIPQIDLFKLNNFQNPAKLSSLKWIQYSLDWPNLQDMPIHHTTEINTIEEINEIISYCINDVKSTKALMKHDKKEIILRQALTEEHKLNLMSSSEPGLAKELFLKFLSEESGVSKQDLKTYRTNRDKIVIKNILLPYISFKTKKFQDLYNAFKNLTVDAKQTKGGFKYTLKDKSVVIEFGLGGIHGQNLSGIYQSTEDTIILSSDVVSYYPNLVIRNKWAPAHLPKQEFCRIYEWLFEERKKIPKKDPRNYVYKIILNSLYGLTNDPYSPFYDPLVTMQVVCNGQLTLMMLYEMIMLAIPEAIPLLQNTDGFEFIVPRDKKDLYMSVCKEWETITKLQLEHNEYKKIIIRDTNNYIALDINNKEKLKGTFDFKDLALHKNKSFLIVPKAIFAYFIDNIPPERFLQENRNIYDYCGGVRSKGDWEFYEICSPGGIVSNRKLQKTIRYYISEKGCKISKVNKTDSREIQIESGPWLQTEFNKYEERRWEEYGVNDKYYLDKIYQEINNICPKPKQQLKLEF